LKKMMANKLKAIPLAIICGTGISIATLVMAPQYVGAPLAFTAGVFGGAATVAERRLRVQVTQEQQARVTAVFSVLYEKNRGIIDPAELSFLANIPGDRAYAFLLALAEQTNGQRIDTKTGLGSGSVFSFAHSANALEQLTKNATNWAQAQTKQLEQQLEAQQQIISLMQLKEQQQTIKAAQFTQDVQEDPWKNQR